MTNELADALFATGEVVGSAYEIRRFVGRGGMAQVFDAHDRSLRRRVAIKAAPRPQLADGSTSPLQLEAQALAAIRHPSLVAVHAIGTWKDVEYLVLEWVEGHTLENQIDERRARNQRFELDEILEVLIPVADGLAAVHHAGGAHRDVKPANVMRAPAGRVVLLDLGIFLPESGLDRPIAGTPHYMAPEAIQNHVPLGSWHRVDLYALGVLAYEMCTLELPYDGEEPIDIFRQHIMAPIPDVRARRPDLPHRLASLISELMAKAPEDRPTDTESVARRLRALQGVHPDRTKALSLLILDDDPDVCELMRLVAQRALPRCEVRVAHNARAGVREMTTRLPDLVIIDAQLPDTQAGELHALLRASRQTGRCAAIAVSGVPRAAAEPIARELGITLFVQKTAALAHDLGETLRHVVDRLAVNVS